MVTLIDALVKECECTVDVLIPGNGEAENELKAHNIPHKILNYHPNFRKIGENKYIRELVKEFINKIAVLKIKKIITQENYDFVCSNSSAVDVAARAAEKLKVPHIYYVREFMEEDFSFEYQKKHRMKRLLEKADKIIFITKAVAEKYTKMYNLKSFRVIYNGINIDDYYIDRHDILFESTLKLLQVGSFGDGKGTMDSLKLIRSAVCQGIDCHLTLVGSGKDDYIRTMHCYIRENSLETYVSILEYSTEIRNIMKEHDVLLMNSRSEGFGRVTVEGMLGGLLVLGRNAAGTREIILNKKNGVLYSSEEEFCSAMHEINQNRNEYREIAKFGQKFAADNYSPTNSARNFMNYLNGE